jgi:transposase
MNKKYKRYPIHLTDKERSEIIFVVKNHLGSMRRITRSYILLLADMGKKDYEIGECLQISRSTVHNVRKRFFNERTINSLDEKARSGRPPKLVGIKAHITTLACSDPPESCKCWTLRLLAARAVQLQLIDTVSHESIRRILRSEG